MDRRPTRFPPKPRLKLGRHANEAVNQPTSKSSASAQPAEEQNKKPDPKDDLVERDADGNYIICAGDPSIIPDKIPEIPVWTDEDADPEPVTGIVDPKFYYFLGNPCINADWNMMILKNARPRSLSCSARSSAPSRRPGLSLLVSFCVVVVV
jgi:hypothetical protein